MRSNKTKKPRSQSQNWNEGTWLCTVTETINMGYLIWRDLHARMVEVELLATMPISEEIQTQTLVLEVEIRI